MNFATLPIVCDFVARTITSPATIQAPINGDLMVLVSFTGTDDAGDASINLSPTLTNLSLAFKQRDSGEVIVQSAAWGLVAGSSPSQFLLHVPMTGEALAQAIEDNGTANLIAELKWEMANPFSAIWGPPTITSRSQDFSVAYTTI